MQSIELLAPRHNSLAISLSAMSLSGAAVSHHSMRSPSFEISARKRLSVPLSMLDATVNATVSGAICRNTRRTSSQFFGVGETLNGVYEIRRLIGRGGMGQVYEAQDHVLGRVVAIKVANPGVQPGKLLREARALVALGGRGVPSVYSMGNYQGLEYCVMERVFGTNLSAHIRQRIPYRPFTVSETAPILEGLAEALVRVHRAGMIHRDLKPENIMLAPQKRIVLIDFGLYRTEGHPWDESGIWGSPRYIAPETITHQVKLGQEHLVDIYAMGVIAFFLLIGCPPFNSKSVKSILNKHVEQVPPRISFIRPDVPEELDRLVSDMLAKDPTRRPASAEEVLMRLRDLKL